MKKLIASIFVFSFLFAGVVSAASSTWQVSNGQTLTVYKGNDVNSGICYTGKYYLYNGNCTSPVATPHEYGVYRKIVEHEQNNQFIEANRLREKWGL